MRSNMNIEEIEQYLNGNLDDLARADFERRMATDVKLATRVDLMRQLDDSLVDQNALDAQKAVFAVSDEFFEEKRSSAKSERSFILKNLNALKIAASVAFVILFSFIIWWQLDKEALSNQELYTHYYESYEASIDTRNDDNDITKMDRAVQYYNAKNYSSAIPLLQEILESNAQDNNALYLLGHSYLNQKPSDTNSAIVIFEMIVQNNKAIEVDQAKWYLALIFLNQDDVESTKQLCKELLNSEEAKLQKKAKELLGHID